ncbi:MAG: hypothetical protein JST48_08595 [Bacteroidetes bacterium]|nr:hypothetical protein [Bacteroidota bacterium]
MDENLFYSLQIASTFSVVPAIIVGIWFRHKVDKTVKVFIVYLLLGFFTDLSGWYFYLIQNSNLNTYVQYFFRLAEALIWFWMINKNTKYRVLKIFFTKLWIVIIPLWSTIFVYPAVLNVYDFITNILIAFASSFCILGIIESENNPTRSLIFWMLTGAFFYFFGVFLIRSTPLWNLAVKIWYLHNLINITTNLIYFIGFLRAKHSES